MERGRRPGLHWLCPLVPFDAHVQPDSYFLLFRVASCCFVICTFVGEDPKLLFSIYLSLMMTADGKMMTAIRRTSSSRRLPMLYQHTKSQRGATAKNMMDPTMANLGILQEIRDAAQRRPLVQSQHQNANDSCAQRSILYCSVVLCCVFRW